MILLAGGAIYLVSKFAKSAAETADEIAKALQLKKSDVQIQSEKQAQDAIKKYIEQAVITQKPSKPDGVWSMLAERIYKATQYSRISDNTREAQACMVSCMNNADFALLYKYYGKRQETWVGFIPDGEPKDLIQCITSNLSSLERQQINEVYARRKIGIRFST